MDTSELAKRMKLYESVSKTRLMPREPVIIRIDGKAFHTFTRGFERPFDEVFSRSMQNTMHYLCKNIQGCVLGYTQSDEISLVLIDYKKLNSSGWFDYEVQKMCSVAASMATMAFNKCFTDSYNEWRWLNEITLYQSSQVRKQGEIYSAAKNSGAMFDARVFNVPKEEVTNNIYWRQLDASRNSILSIGQANFSHKELQNKSCNDIQDMLLTKKGINWNDYPVYQKRGCCCIRERYFCSEGPLNKKNAKAGKNLVEVCGDIGVWRTRWIIDKNIPIFKGEGREYIERLIQIPDDETTL